MRPAIALCLMLLILLTDATVQASPEEFTASDLKPGDTLRVRRHHTSRPVLGRLHAIDSDTVKLVVSRRDRLLEIPRDDIRGVELQLHSESNTRRYAGNGARVGVGASLLLAVLSQAGGEAAYRPSFFAVLAGSLFIITPVTATIGALLGLASSSGSWANVQSDRASLGLTPSNELPRLRLALQRSL